MRKLLLSTALCFATLSAPAAQASSELTEGLIKMTAVKIDNSNVRLSDFMQPTQLTLDQLSQLLKGPHKHKMANGREYELTLSPVDPSRVALLIEMLSNKDKTPTDAPVGQNNNNDTNASAPGDQNNNNETKKEEETPAPQFLLVPSLRPAFLEHTVITEQGSSSSKVMTWNIVWNLMHANDSGFALPVELLCSEIYDVSKLPKDLMGDFIYPEPVYNWFIKAPVISDKEIPQNGNATAPASNSPTAQPTPAVPAKRSMPNWNMNMYAPPMDKIDNILGRLQVHLKHVPQTLLNSMRANFTNVYMDIYAEWATANHQKFKMSKEEAVAFLYANWILQKPEAANKWFVYSPNCAPADFDAKKYLANNPSLLKEAEALLIPAETYAKTHYVNIGYNNGYNY